MYGVLLDVFQSKIQNIAAGKKRISSLLQSHQLVLTQMVYVHNETKVLFSPILKCSLLFKSFYANVFFCLSIVKSEKKERGKLSVELLLPYFSRRCSHEVMNVECRAVRNM